MQRPRRVSRPVQVGSVQVGGGAPISVQSMTVSKTHDVETSLGEIIALAEAGADIVRVAVPRAADVGALPDIADGRHVSVAADHHLNYPHPLRPVDAGGAAVRLTPGAGGKDAGRHGP